MLEMVWMTFMIVSLEWFLLFFLTRNFTCLTWCVGNQFILHKKIMHSYIYLYCLAIYSGSGMAVAFFSGLYCLVNFPLSIVMGVPYIF